MLPEKPLTKKQIGLLALLGGIFMLIGVMGYDVAGMGSPDGGFGPTQKIGLAAAMVVILLGLSLLLLGDQAA